MKVYSLEDVPLEPAVVQRFYERWRHPSITNVKDSVQNLPVIDKDGTAHYGFLTTNPDLRDRARQSEFQLKDYRDSFALFREIFADFVQELPADTTKKEQIIYLKLVLGDHLSTPSNSMFGLSTTIDREYAAQLKYDRENKTVFERGDIPEQLHRELIDEHSGCAKCGAEGDIELHHIVPFARGGATERDNLAPLCADCRDAAPGSYDFESKESFWNWVNQ